MMSSAIKSKDRVKKSAEVFTPANIVFDMLLTSHLRDILNDLDKTIFDPAAGQGQFPCAELFLKMFFNLDNLSDENCLRAVNSIHAVEIQADNCREYLYHFVETFKSSYEFLCDKPCPVDLLIKVAFIAKKNLINDDFLKVFGDSNKQMNLF